MKVNKLKKWKILFRRKPHKNIMAYECQIWSKKTFKKKKRHKITMSHECQTWYLVTRLYIWQNQDFFGLPLKTFPLEIVELIEKLKKFKKNVRTWGCGNSRFRNMALWRGVTHFYFLQDKYFAKNFYTIF